MFLVRNPHRHCEEEHSYEHCQNKNELKILQAITISSTIIMVQPVQ